MVPLDSVGNQEAPRWILASDIRCWGSRGTAIDPRVWHIFLLRFGHENISRAILPLPLIQEEHLSVNKTTT